MEIWKDIKGHEGSYQVSNAGKVRSVLRTVKSRHGKRVADGMMIRPFVCHGYYRVKLRKDSLQYKFYVHRLVAEAFVSNPHKKPIINHINGIKSDNRIENLEWVTNSENIRHAYDTGLRNPNRPYRRFNNEQIIQIRLLANSMGLKLVASKFNTTPKDIRGILKRSSLLKAIEWIKDNLKPDQVFEEDQLIEWGRKSNTTKAK